MPTDLAALARRAPYHYSERLCLRPVALTDAWPLWEATRDPRFNAHLLWAQPSLEIDLFERIEQMHELARRNQVLTLACTWRSSGCWAGVFRYAPMADGLETSIWLHPNFWTEPGLATEFGRLGLHVGFMEGGVSRLYARSLADNKAVHKLMGPSGFSPLEDGTLVDEAGLERKYVLYGIDRARHEALGTEVFGDIRLAAARPEPVRAPATHSQALRRVPETA